MLLAADFWNSLIHPLSNGGGTLFGGIGGDLGEITLITAVIVTYRKNMCHVDGCYRIGHIDPHNHHPACKKHHSHRDKLGKPPRPVD